MSQLSLPQSNFVSTDFEVIKTTLKKYGVEFQRWEASHPLKVTDDQDTILKAFEKDLKPFMKKSGFKTADVINVHPETPNLSELREKFIKEHTHSEDEVRFFVDGSGLFWFNFDDGTVARLKCEKGDFLSVPKGYKHWFDLAPEYFVKAIRVFSNKEGWVANYTNSGVDSRYAEL